MKRNLDVIIKNLESRYEIFITKELKNPKLYYSVRPDCKDKTYLGSLDSNYTIVSNPAVNQRIYFIVSSEDSQDLIASTSYIPLRGIENFRDLGGYRTIDGKSVKWGHFFRSGALANLTDEEKAFCDNLGLGYILDYRVPHEAQLAMDYVSVHTTYLNVPAFEANPEPKQQMSNMDMAKQLQSIKTEKDADSMKNEFKAIYHKLPFKNPAYQHMFSLLDQGKPFVQHCSAGKDRTGIGCALLLLALGVDQETVIGDYLLSAVYRETVNQKYMEQFVSKSTASDWQIKVINSLLSVERSFIEASFNEIDKKYHSIENFLLDEYGIQEDKLNIWRNQYLY